MKRDHTSYSEAALFARCNYAHHLRYHKGLQKIHEADYLRLGSLVDKGLQSALHSHSNGETWSDAIYESEARILNERDLYLKQPHVAEWAGEQPPEGGDTIEEESAKLANKAAIIADRTIKYLELGTDKWTTVSILGKPAIQYELNHTIPGADKPMLGYLDWVATNREGETHLIDFKVRKKRSSQDAYYDMLEDDWQLPLYTYVLNQMVIRVTSVVHLNIYGQLPKEPKVNKNGSISKAACDTDWATYSNAVLRAGRNPDVYLDMKEKLDAKSWITWTQRTVTPEEMGFAVRQLSTTAWEMPKSIARSPPRNISALNCGMCSYRTYCRMDRQGYDADSLVGTQYYIKGEESSLVNIQRLPKVEGDSHEVDERE